MSWVVGAPAAWSWLLVLLLPAATGVGWWAARVAAARRRRVLGRREAAIAGAPSFGRARPACAAAVVLCALLAALQPAASGDDGTAGPDLVFGVDVSRSMAAADATPSRFARLVADLDDLLGEAVTARVAVVAYAGEARVIAPLSADRSAAGWLVHELAPGALGRGGSDPGQAIAVAADLLARADTAGQIVLLGDGEDFAGAGRDAARAAAAAGHVVHCVGYGSDGGSKIVVGDGDASRFLRDARGDEIVTRLDLDGLRAIARSGDGSCVRADSPGALVAFYREVLRPRAAALRLRRGDATLVPRFQWPLSCALLFWMLRWWLPERRRGTRNEGRPAR